MPNHGDDFNIRTHTGSSGIQFLGLIRNIKVYDEPMVPMPAESLTWGSVKELFR
ncbi:hypothetical protein H8E07_09465 [bacterium]|nr:hypothetical protein [bacterium]